VRLGDVVTIGARWATPRPADKIPFVPMSHIPEDSLYLSTWEQRSLSEVRSGVVFREGDLLLAKITPCLENGKQAVARGIPGGWGYATTEVFPITPTAFIDVEYLAFYLKLAKVRSYLADSMEGTTGRQRLARSVLQQLLIPLPPVNQQRAIAGVLSTIQRAIEATDKVIAATRKFKASLMRHLFTYGPVPVADADTVELQETEIGAFPAHWEIVPLADVVRRTSQIDPKRRPNWAFRYVDVSSVDNVRLQIINSTPLDSSVAPSRARKLIETNDVIFATVRPYLRRIALVPSELNGQICSTAFCVIRADPKRADSTYIYFAVSDQAFVERVAAHQHGTGYPAVTDSVVLQEAIPLPPLEDQVLVSKTLRSVDSKVETELKRKAALELAFNAALQALMTGNLRVLDSGSDDGTVQ
jgi:type I restriction enzyme S subunit